MKLATTTVLASLFWSALACAITPSPVQLVLTTPVETDLEAPGFVRADQAWIEMIRAARKSVDMEQFYVSNEPNSSLEPVIVELERAAARGVKVRMIFEQNMIDNDKASIARLKAMPGAELRVIHLPKGILHSKHFIIDGRRVYVGSQNFDWRALTHIHETGILVDDDGMAAQLSAVFEYDWAYCAGDKAPKIPAAPAVTDPSLTLVSSPARMNPPGVPAALPALLQLLNGAKKRITVQVMTYSPVTFSGEFNPVIDNALRAAAVRGVKVQLMVANWNTDKPAIDHLKSLSLIPNVELKIVSIPEASTGHIPYARVTHSKVLTVDEQIAWVGTSNWEPGYFLDSRDIEIIVRRPEYAQQALGAFEKLWGSTFAEKIDPLKHYIPPKKD